MKRSQKIERYSAMGALFAKTKRFTQVCRQTGKSWWRGTNWRWQGLKIAAGRSQRRLVSSRALVGKLGSDRRVWVCVFGVGRLWGGSLRKQVWKPDLEGVHAFNPNFPCVFRQPLLSMRYRDWTVDLLGVWVFAEKNKREGVAYRNQRITRLF